jgi:hypothetical protein
VTEPLEEEGPLGFDELLDQAELPEDTVDVCLRGDLVAKYHGLQQQLAAVPDAPAGSGSLAGNSAKTELLQELEALRRKMRRATQKFTMRALSDRAYSEFLKGHQPRPEDRRDMLAGYNRDTMGPALLRLCVVDPVISAAQWEKLRDKLSPGEWAKLDLSARNLNFAEVNVPFSPAVSQNPPSSGFE